ncbi:MAG: TolB family protein [Caldilineaceae bacterium]|nr:TolB family protein [Caldilineaceae bacterium]
MNRQSSLPIWLALGVLIIGVSSLLLLGIQPPSTVAQTTIDPLAAFLQSEAVTTTVVAALTPFSETLAVDELTLTPTATPLPPLVLPNVTVPEGGEVYLLTPSNPEAVGWAQDQDEAANHLGDYNIYAGFFDGQQRVGAMQFDLSTIPPGAPIVYADLTLTGLADEWLAADGVWTAQILAPWIDKDWVKRDFHWLARPDSGLALLDTPLSSAELAIARSNTLTLPPAALAQLGDRLFTGLLSIRISGPTGGENNLFAWDSGYGARTSGRGPVLRIVTNGPVPAAAPPSPTPAYVVITLTPTDDRAVVAMAVERMTMTAVAPPPPTGTQEPTVTATPFPPNWVTPVVMVNTPTPENAATAAWVVRVVTAQALVRGTTTPTPPNVWTATATPLPPPPTPTPMIVAYDLLTATAIPSPTPTAIPGLLRNKILFWSDRNGGATLMLMDPDGSNLAFWTGGEPKWIHEQAKLRHDLSPDGQARVVVSSQQVRNAQLWIINLANGNRRQLTTLNQIAYDPVWSPLGNQIAFISPEPGNDELFVINVDGSGLTQLTHNDWEWDKYPSWSPDGRQLVFWSNRDTQRKQIWIMNADGSNVRNLSNNEFNDWEPIWVK